MAYSFIDKFGYRRQRANPISRVGVFPYTGEQIDQPKKNPFTGKPIIKKDDNGNVVYKKNAKTGEYIVDSNGNKVPEYEMQFGLEPNRLYPVLRGPDALFDPAAIDSFNGIPIRIGHLMIGDESKNKKEEKDKKLYSADKNPNDGCIYNVRPSLDEPGYLIADFCIYTDRMKEVLEEGKVKELSLGYTSVYEAEDGLWEGIPYKFKQTNLRGNHLALVKHGRCGSSVCVYDSAVVTFDSLPEANGEEQLETQEDESQTVVLDKQTKQEKEPQMDETKKEETGKLERVKALASAIKGGDEQLAQDCLDFADFPPEVRKEALERCKAGKCEKKEDEKEVADKSPKSTKDDAVAVPPEPPKSEAEKEAEKPAESNAPAASAVSAPAPAAEPEPSDNPAPEGVESPKDGEMPAKDCKDKAEKPTCDKCGKDSCECGKEKVEEVVAEETKEVEDKATKDCGTGVTTPSIPTPVAALETVTEKKEEKEVEDKGCKDTEPKLEVVSEKKETVLPDGTEETKVEVVAEKAAEDKKVKAEAEEVKEEAKKVETKEKVEKEKVVQDYAAFVAEYTTAQALANTLRPFIKETFDSAPMRVIDVARFAAQHIENLAFVQDEADDEKVMNAVRGYAAAVTMDAAAKKEEVFEDTVKSADVIVQDEAPKSVVSKASSKDLLAFMSR